MNENDSKINLSVKDEVTGVYQRLMANVGVQQALAFAEADHVNTIEEQVAITEIPAPPFHEEFRRQDYQLRLQKLGLSDVKVDNEGNVFGVRRGKGIGPTVFVCAHLDTVFPVGTDTTVRRREGKLFAPGIADDGRGLTVTLAVLRALNETRIETVGDIVFGATVGEEGLGDLRGVKAFFRNCLVDGFISIEPDSPARTTYLGTGSHRYRITFHGPGGHSFSAFGTPSAVHAMGRAISRIADLDVAPGTGKTTFTVGTVVGGTSVNTIAATAEMMVDIRSDEEKSLLEQESRILASIQQAVWDENQRWRSDAIRVQVTQVGDRPAGRQAEDAVIVQASVCATEVLGLESALDGPSSTDANVPIALGIPAVTLGGGGTCGGLHTLDEYFDPADGHLGVQKVLLTVLGLVGVHQTTLPLLQKRTSKL